MVKSRKHKRPYNNGAPQYNVKTNDPTRFNEIRIDFTRYNKWTYTVRVKNFNNHLQNEKEALRHFYFILSELLKYVQEKGIAIFSGQVRHCHIIQGEHYTLARTVVNEI